MVVSGTPLADRSSGGPDEPGAAQAPRDETAETIVELSEERDRLLERLFEDIDSAEPRRRMGPTSMTRAS